MVWLSVIQEPATGKTRRFLRSVQLARDFEDPEALDGYVLTAQVRQVIGRLEEALRPAATERAWTLTGPYGSGKSMFALFFARLLSEPSPEANPAWRMLFEQDAALADKVHRHVAEMGLMPVPVTSRRTALSTCVLEGLTQALRKLPPTDKTIALQEILEQDMGTADLDGEVVLRRVEEFTQAAVQVGRYRGLLLILDELGKALEHAARDPRGDISFLQDLAELAARSGDHPIILVGILHQSFDQYGQYLAPDARTEWARVQGRFSDIGFVEPPAQQMWLIAQAAASLQLGTCEWERTLADIAERVAHTGCLPAGLRDREFVEVSARAFPLHPTVLVALPHMFRRFGQNERSLFAFLVSQEPFGVQDLVGRRGPGLVRLPDLFDYFVANLSNSAFRQPFARRWAEVVDALDRAHELGPLETDVLKAIGILSVLGPSSTPEASEPLLSLALRDRSESGEVSEALATLRARSLIVYRRFSSSYRIWEGSDIDIESRLEEGRRRTGGQIRLGESLRRYLAYRPLVARRHSYSVGALRFFEVVYLDDPVLNTDLPKPEGVDGIVACCLPSSPHQCEAFARWAQSEEMAARAEVVVALPRQIEAVRQMAAELQALHWVCENTPELRDDRVARKELAERTSAVEQLLSQLLERLLDPRSEPKGFECAWFHRGKKQLLRNPIDVSRFLSEVMDQLYPYAPRIRNELVNRRSLSPTAAAARRSLMERMLTEAARPLLGMEGFPPERSMYESVLRATGLHREKAPGIWAFAAPPSQDPRGMAPAWEEMRRVVFESLVTPYPVDRLFAHLSAPPYGVMPGVLPVLLVAFLLAYPDEVSLYREGCFIPEPSLVDLDVLVRRPELFAVGGARARGERGAVLERMANRLSVEPTTVSVARALVQTVRCLPEHAWRTQDLGVTTVKIREAFERARSPEKLLFHDLPLALGEEPFGEQEPNHPERIERFFAKLNAALSDWVQVTPSRIARARDVLLGACRLPTGEAGWAILRSQARQLEPVVTQPPLLPFVRRLATEGDGQTVLEGVLGLIAGRPPQSWTDTEVERFPSQAAILGRQFADLAASLGVLSPDEEETSRSLASEIKRQLAGRFPAHIVRTTLARLLHDV